MRATRRILKPTHVITPRHHLPRLADEGSLETLVVLHQALETGLGPLPGPPGSSPGKGLPSRAAKGRARLNSVGRLHRRGVGGGGRSLGL
jgi:hypothetical protein